LAAVPTSPHPNDAADGLGPGDSLTAKKNQGNEPYNKEYAHRKKHSSGIFETKSGLFVKHTS
jgi:hypothetical protein